MALRRVLRSDAFYSAIEPYRAIWCIALPPDQRFPSALDGSTADARARAASTADASPSAPCAKCWGVSASNAYHNLAHARGVAMIRGATLEPPTSALARLVFGRDGDAAQPGGVLLAPTTHRAVTVADAERVAKILQLTDARFRDVPFGFWDGPSAPSWRAPEESLDAADRDAPAAARVARARLQEFLESTQGALNTFG